MYLSISRCLLAKSSCCSRSLLAKSRCCIMYSSWPSCIKASCLSRLSCRNICFFTSNWNSCSLAWNSCSLNRNSCSCFFASDWSSCSLNRSSCSCFFASCCSSCSCFFRIKLLVSDFFELFRLGPHSYSLLDSDNEVVDPLTYIWLSTPNIELAPLQMACNTFFSTEKSMQNMRTGLQNSRPVCDYKCCLGCVGHH